ncbi:MAG: hypothetical protein ACQKBV_03730, partial [Puniceicoccales bacterium]
MKSSISKLLALVAMLCGFSALTTDLSAQTPTVDIHYVDVNNTNRRLPGDTITMMRGVYPHLYAIRVNVNWNGSPAGAIILDFRSRTGTNFTRGFPPQQTSFLVYDILPDSNIGWLNGAEIGANEFEVRLLNPQRQVVAASRPLAVRAILVPRFVQHIFLNGNQRNGVFEFELNIPPGDGYPATTSLPLIGKYGPT